VGDILKVFHFTGARRKRYFMYKQVIGEEMLGSGTTLSLQVAHLNMKPFDDSDGGYWITKDGTKLDRYEIVQGIDGSIEDRPKTWSA
jgi:hypothetical protein